MKSFKLVLNEGESLPVQKVPKNIKGKKTQLTFNVLDEMDETEDEDKIFSIRAELFDYGDVVFRSISALVSYVSQKSFPCHILLEGKPYGYWSPEQGITKF
jgi:hypothetical protein